MKTAVPKVLLIDPPDVKGAKDRNLQLPLGLVSLSSHLKQNQLADPKVIDLTLTSIEQDSHHLSSLLSIEGAFSENWDIVGLTTHFTNTLASLSIAKLIKAKNPNAIIVFGGIHATSCTHALLNNFPLIDFIITGEGEQALASLCRYWKGQIPINEVPNLSYLESNTVKTTRKAMLDLDTVKAYDFSKIDLRRYQNASRVSSFWLESGRGCVHKCGFCISAKHWGYRSRYFTPEKLVADMQTLYKNGIRHIKFTHDQFSVNQKKVTAICNEIIKSNLKMTWGCYSRLDQFPHAILKLMYQAGCRSIFVGVESKISAVQSGLKKASGSEVLEKAMSACEEAGIELESNIILGFPEHSEEALLDELLFCAYLKERNFSRLSISPLELYPSTPYYQDSNYRELFNLKGKAENQMEPLFSFRFEHKRRYFGVSVKILAEHFRTWSNFFPSTIKALLENESTRKLFANWIKQNRDLLENLHEMESMDSMPEIVDLFFKSWGQYGHLKDRLILESALALRSAETPSSLTLYANNSIVLKHNQQATLSFANAFLNQKGFPEMSTHTRFQTLITESDNELIVEKKKLTKGEVNEETRLFTGRYDWRRLFWKQDRNKQRCQQKSGVYTET